MFKISVKLTLPLLLSIVFFSTLAAMAQPHHPLVGPSSVAQLPPNSLTPLFSIRSLKRADTLSVPVSDSLSQPLINSAEWNDTCIYQKMEISGIGMGNTTNPINPQTLFINDPTNIKWQLAQVAGRYSDNAPTPDSVTFTTSAPQSLTLSQPSNNNSTGYTFEANLQATNQVTALINNPGNDYKTPRGLILYTKRTVSDFWTSIGKTMNRFVYRNSYTETFAVPPLTQTTDLFITAIVIDNQDDTRPLILEARAGDIVQRTSPITGPTDGPLLNIIRLTLPQVPTGTNQINITLQSPSNNGDSLVWVGVNVSYRCVGSPSGGADLAVTKTVNNTNPHPGDIITYTVTVTNNGPEDATGVEISDTLSISLTFERYTTTQGIYSGSLWRVGSLSNTASVTLTIEAKVKGGTAGQVITNNAIIPVTAENDPISNNNKSTVIIEVTQTVSRLIFLPLINKNYCLPFTDTFSNSGSGWPEVNNSPNLRTKYFDNEYQMLTKAKGLHYAYNLYFADYYTNYEVEVDTHWISNTSTGKGYGIIFGLAYDDSYAYLFQINTDNQQYRLLRLLNGSWKYYENNSWHLPTDTKKGWVYTNSIFNGIATNHLYVSRRNSQIILYINKLYLLTVTDNAINAGRVGLSVERYDNDSAFGTRNANAGFDNYTLNLCPLITGMIARPSRVDLSIGVLPSTD